MVEIDIILYVGFLLIGWITEILRHNEDGKEQAILYGDQRSKIHDVQERENRFVYIKSYCLAGLFSVAVSSNNIETFIFLFLSIFISYSATLYGNYWFQVRINRIFGFSDVNPEEKPTWYSTERDREIKKGFIFSWYGSRRKYQRQTAVGMFFISMVIILLIKIL